MSTDELTQIRDELVARLDQLDQMRDDLVDVLGSIRAAIGEDQPAAASPRRAAKAKPARKARPASA